MITSAKLEVQLIVDAFKKTNVSHIVLSPGSRNAPLSIAFDEDPFFTTFLIPDERSAAFIALGLAQQLKRPVAIACTSGSAPLNYYPAVVEAFYQKIPLIVLTADRPAEWTDQGDGQTIRQQNVFGSHVVDFQQLDTIKSKEDQWFFERKLAKSFHAASRKKSGPVHLNIPFSEPLYEVSESSAKINNWISFLPTKSELATESKKELDTFFANKKKHLIIVGQHNDDSISSTLLQNIIDSKNTIVLSEHTSNLSLKNSIDCIDQILNCMIENQEDSFYPDLIIQLGDAIISKKIKRFLRKSNAPVIRVNESFTDMDVFQNLSYSLAIDTNSFLEFYSSHSTVSELNFFSKWNELVLKVNKSHELSFPSVPFCDLKVVNSLMRNLKQATCLHISNSSMIRYILLFENDKNNKIYCNRGTSGIDGSTSTAVGAALANPDVNHVMLTGDLSFFYDSNALWNRYFPKNLRIVIVNNGGGDIFNIIPGPDSTNQHKSIFVAEQSISAELLVKNFGLTYEGVKSIEEFETAFISNQAQVIEVNTMGIENSSELKKYFQKMRM
jgi:2-succinyl-5-enolpyruvyl-6-hydroxy-3-cyclohexene-1-carboxylate synthase